MKLLTILTLSMTISLASAPVFADNHQKSGEKAAVAKKEKALSTIFNKDGKAILSITESDLKSFPEVTFKATTPWYPKTVEFKGVSFKAVLEKAGIKSTDMLTVVAWDKYSTDVPAADAFEHNVMLATHADGVRMDLKNKGPLFIMYPMDDNPKLKDNQFYNRSVWSIKEIRVKK